MTPLAELALKIAASNIGRKEATGNNDGPFVKMLQLLAVDGGHSMDNEPWCAMHATYCIQQAAAELKLISKIPLNPSSTSIYAFAKAHGLLMTSPAPGCIGLIKAPTGSGKTHDHTFLVYGVEDGYVDSTDGNWNNQVMQTKHKITDCDFVLIV